MLNSVKQLLNHTGKGRARRLSLPTLEEFLPVAAREFAKGKIYREMRVSAEGFAAFAIQPRCLILLMDDSGRRRALEVSAARCVCETSDADTAFAEDYATGRGGRILC